MNVYINELNSRIIKRKFINNKTHLVSKENILLDYKKYNIEEEEVFINDFPVEDIYESSLGFAMVASFKASNDKIKIYVDYDKRIKILESLTLRLVIKNCLDKYFNLKVSNFYTSPDESYFEIDGIYFDEEANKISTILTKNINTYLSYNLAIRSNKKENKTMVNGLIDTEYFPYHLSSLSEIPKFNIIRYKIINKVLRIYYSTR